MRTRSIATDLMSVADTCQRCGGTLRIVASIEQPEVIAKILPHLERTAPLQPEVPLGARAPPVQSTLL